MAKRKCKVCGCVFEKQRPLQFVCSPKCGIEYQREQKRKAAIKSEREPEKSPGASSMPNFSESPNGGGACSLSQVLEASAPPKYFLSDKAKQGILQRAARRGKTLPPLLRAALERTSNQPSAAQ